MAPELIGNPDDGLLVRPGEYSDIYSFGGIMLQVCRSDFSLYADH
jgi:hypothetical protein